MRKITIAIDGFSSTGKSTIAKMLADYLEYIYVDSGAMYRAVTFYGLKHNFYSENHFDTEKLIAALPDISLNFVKSAAGKLEIFLNGNTIEKEIRSLAVSEFVSPVAAISQVRKKLVEQQQEIGKNKGVVMDGRDIGTVVFPNAELKIFMTASSQIRAQRRFLELQEMGFKITFDEVLANIEERDHIDTTRADSPLTQAKDAIVIDNTETNIEDQFHIILQLAKDRIAGRI